MEANSDPHSPAAFPPSRRGKNPLYPPDSTLGGPQKWSSYKEEEKKLLHLLAIEP